MKIKAAQKIADGLQSYPAGTVINWPDDVPLPLNVGVEPATAADEEAVYDALAKGHARRIKEQEQALKRPGLTPQQVEMMTLALQRYQGELTRVLNLAGKRPKLVRARAGQAAPNPASGDHHPDPTEPDSVDSVSDDPLA